MSDIETNLNKILISRYGKDVRQAIHDGIHDCYEDGKAGAVDLVAREQIANLVANEGTTEKDSELVDIRVGVNGTTYTSAGEAVREQIKDANEKMYTVRLYAMDTMNKTTYDLVSCNLRAGTTIFVKEHVPSGDFDSDARVNLLGIPEDGQKEVIIYDVSKTGEYFKLTKNYKALGLWAREISGDGINMADYFVDVTLEPEPEPEYIINFQTGVGSVLTYEILESENKIHFKSIRDTSIIKFTSNTKFYASVNWDFTLDIPENGIIDVYVYDNSVLYNEVNIQVHNNNNYSYGYGLFHIQVYKDKLINTEYFNRIYTMSKNVFIIPNSIDSITTGHLFLLFDNDKTWLTIDMRSNTISMQKTNLLGVVPHVNYLNGLISDNDPETSGLNALNAKIASILEKNENNYMSLVFDVTLKKYDIIRWNYRIPSTNILLAFFNRTTLFYTHFPKDNVTFYPYNYKEPEPEPEPEKIKIMCLGDSITALGTGTRGWIKYFMEKIPSTLVANTAVNSAVLPDYSDTVYDGNPSSSNQHGNVLGNQVQKILNNNYEAPDVILIAIGTNSGINITREQMISTYYGSDHILVPLDDVDRTTHAGAYRYCLDTLHAKYPNALIIWCTPIMGFEATRSANNACNWAESLRIATEYTGQLLCETIRCGINGINEKKNENGEYLIDGLHPNEKGAKKIGYFNAAFVESYRDMIL